MPIRKYLGVPDDSPQARVIVYAELVGITLVALIIGGVTGVWLLSQYYSQNGLSGTEVTLLVTGTLAVLNQLGIWRSGKMAKAIHQEVNGKDDKQKKLAVANQTVLDDKLDVILERLGATAPEADTRTETETDKGVDDARAE